MQKFPLRNQCKPPSNNNKVAFGCSTNSSSNTHIQRRMRRDCCSSPHEMPLPSGIQQKLQRICQPIIPSAPSPTATSIEKRQLSMEKPSRQQRRRVKVCNRVFTEEAENVATWDDVLCKKYTNNNKQSKSLPSAVSFALEREREVVMVDLNAPPVGRMEPVQRITSTAAAGGILEVPSNVTASSSNTNKNNKNKKNNNKIDSTNGNRNKDDVDDDDDDNNRRSRLEKQQQQQQNHQSKTQAEAAAVMPAAASASEFITFERLRLGDQINFLLFDPYRTLKFLITELKSRLKTVVPDDINVQKILVEIQQTIKRIRLPNASEPPQPPELQSGVVVPRRVTSTTVTTTNSTEGTAEIVTSAAAAAETVKNISPKERCHVIKNDPLINHASKVNSSCQTIAAAASQQLQLENNVNACQMCEHHQVNHHQGITVVTVGCNQNRINENNYSNAEVKADDVDDNDGMMEINLNRAYQERSKDHRKDTEVRESFSCKSLQDIIENLKIKNNPFSRDTQRIITQLETELLNFQRELQRTSSSSSTSSSLSVPHDGSRPLGKGSKQEEYSKVQSKRRLLLDDKKLKNPEQEQDQNVNENEEGQEQTFPDLDFIADKLQPKLCKQHCNRLSSSSTHATTTPAGALSTISKESQTNLKSPTQMFCHLEKEKLLLMQEFRTSEMQSIQGDLNELHVFIKEQLNAIYHSITRDFSNPNSMYFSNEPSRRRRLQQQLADKNKRKSRQKIFSTLQHHQPEKTKTKGLSSPPLLLSSSPSLTAPTSSSSSNQQRLRMYEGAIPFKSSKSKLTSILPRHYKKSSSSPIRTDDNGNANNTKSMMKQKSSSSSLSTAGAGALTDAKKQDRNISDVDKTDKAVCGSEKKSKDSYQQLYGHQEEHLRARCRFAPETPFYSDGGKRNHHFSNVDCGCRGFFPLSTHGTQMDDDGKVQRIMAAKATTTIRTSTTKSDINSTKETPRHHGPAVMTHHHQRHQQQPATTTTGIAQERIQLISSSLPASKTAAAKPSSYITTRTITDDTSVSPDTVTNAAVKTIIKDAYATTVTAVTAAATAIAIPRPETAGHSNGIREQPLPSHQIRNSWQRVNLKNPTGCQMKKQICGPDGYELTINNNNDNRSNYPEIHDCQKYRANSSINPSFCGLCWTKMHEVGADNGATAFAFAATASDKYDDDDENVDSENDNDDVGYRDDVGTGSGADGDGPINWKEENESSSSLAIEEGDFTCHHPKKQRQRHQQQWRWRRRKQPTKLLHCCVAAQSAFQTDLEEFKEFLDEIALSTPRRK
ncbi:uncharacterized protein LOC129912225 isoform X1 [Episyrphus balteatus]|uniref:uncharacterized protein LOC129912225 isoform X1 n=1 Tax=Episyrphus balteatus TaxID=286459 RepID=UPI002485466A|nr:uncharacterized protein LOC129912225 isoform X1 [Episyrphus balteatus]